MKLKTTIKAAFRKLCRGKHHPNSFRVRDNKLPRDYLTINNGLSRLKELVKGGHTQVKDFTITLAHDVYILYNITNQHMVYK